jgi:hypothetical protein
LSNSTRTGLPERINTNRKYLRRALDLGFRELHLFAPDQPIVCVDDRRKYIWALLTPSEVIKPSDDVVRISSDIHAASTTTNTTQPQQESPMPKAEQAATNEQPQATTSSTEELIGQAEQLKVSLRETLRHTSELIVGLKRHRKEAKIVRSTLDSLRQLQTVG